MAYVVTYRTRNYTSPVWNAAEYLALFGIVLLHEFGHALACRQVGGRANQIVLWPLGGVAYVDPPPRPGTTLWSIAAGPLVNVALLPVFWVLWALAGAWGWRYSLPNAYEWVKTIFVINLVLLIFNLLPVYPLDGGQILRSLLWFVIGRARSLLLASAIGIVGVAGLISLAVLTQNWWLGVVGVFILLNCWGGFMQARALAKIAARPRHTGLACPACQAPPPEGAFWVCGSCQRPFDAFARQAVCPHCGTQYDVAKCLDCGALSPFHQWVVAGTVPPRL